MNAFARALGFTLVSEGGYVNNPADHGGPTNHGITQATYDVYRKTHALYVQSVQFITDAEVHDCYYTRYWLPAHCDDMSAALATCVFDWAVNHGVLGALFTLQEVLGIQADGVYGPLTHQAITLQDDDGLWRSYNQARRDWYQQDAANRPSQAQFLDGWLHRVDRLDAFVESL